MILIANSLAYELNFRSLVELRRRRARAGRFGSRRAVAPGVTATGLTRAAGGSRLIDTPDTPDLPAARADDVLIEAIIHGVAVRSSDPAEQRLIDLLMRWRSWSAGRPPEHSP